MPQFSNTSYSNNNSFAPPPATTNYNPYSMDAAPSKPPKVAIQNLLDLGDDMPSSPQVQRPAAYAPFEEIPKQASQPAQNNTPVDLVSQLSTLSIGADLSAHVQYIAPKQVYLNANAAKGLEIQGTFARRRGNAYLDLTVSNKALQPMTDFAIQFNKNTYVVFNRKMLVAYLFIDLVCCLLDQFKSDLLCHPIKVPIHLYNLVSVH